MLFLKKNTDHPLVKNRYIILFIVIMSRLFLSPLVSTNWGFIIAPVFDFFLFAALMLIVQKFRKAFWILGAFGFIAVALGTFGGFAYAFGLFLFAAFIGIVAVELFSDLLGKKSVGLNEMIGALDGYILIGFIGAQLFLIVNFFFDNAFSNLSEGPAATQDLIYFSFITMLTIGYGEIVPLIPAARNMVILVGLLGQFYLVVVIATFVGKFMKDR
ncbi:potassium channel family protein [Reichenbachiella ulvae]|uniref:Potassium channel family protein n=1 Tax=Reichenbachiella ulvae TaxID=2980104 RepID=A0ABT3CQA1_9BACT|nr:potassium channel family protein [Reichenbachiella ulvae]MCV9385792.1 potassium channel family protein [Reichenbachiella ulvae]